MRPLRCADGTPTFIVELCARGVDGVRGARGTRPLEGVRGARWWRVGVPWAGLGSREPCSGLFGGSPPPTLEPGGSWPLGRREWPLLRPSMAERGRWATP